MANMNRYIRYTIFMLGAIDDVCMYDVGLYKKWTSRLGYKCAWGMESGIAACQNSFALNVDLQKAAMCILE